MHAAGGLTHVQQPRRSIMTCPVASESAPNLTDIARSSPAAVVNENLVRAAAGITMALGAVAFAYAYFERRYWPLQVVATFFFVEFFLRVTAGLPRSPVGLVAGWLTRRQPALWLSARPKRFAWSLGLGLSGAMAVITNVGIRGWIPRSICLLCLSLMWLESVLGLCLGCEIHALLRRRGWVSNEEAFGPCAHGACDESTRA
jgi:hypothetical protein